MGYKSDIEIAQSVTPEHISVIAKRAGVADKYLELLSKTAIGDYEEILKPFGLNPKNADFWQKGLNLISSYIDELEKLDKKMN